MPSRADLHHLVVWCDTGVTRPPFQWLRAEFGAAMSVHRLTPSGDVIGGLTAIWKGRLTARGAVPGISEFPDQPIRFEGTLPGVRNPAKTAQVTVDADADSIAITLAGPTLRSEWRGRFDVTLVVNDDGGVVRILWNVPSANDDPAQLFELALWPDLGIGVDLGPP